MGVQISTTDIIMICSVQTLLRAASPLGNAMVIIYVRQKWLLSAHVTMILCRPLALTSMCWKYQLLFWIDQKIFLCLVCALELPLHLPPQDNFLSISLWILYDSFTVVQMDASWVVLVEYWKPVDDAVTRFKEWLVLILHLKKRWILHCFCRILQLAYWVLPTT